MLARLARKVAAQNWDLLAAGKAVETELCQLVGRSSLDQETKRAVVATLALRLPIFMDQTLPPSILQCYPRAVETLTDFLERGEVYDEDLFAKDVRFVSGATVPVGAQVVDVLFSNSVSALLGRARRTAGTFSRLIVAGQADVALQFLRRQGFGKWLQIHTDVRDTSEFNPEGWNRCYVRIADLLAVTPDLAGMLGISWFYDPKVSTISPRLSYLQDLPLANGAFTVKLRPGPIHTARAAATSPSRRRLIESGAYVPVCYALFWPRQEILRWSLRERSAAT